MRVVSILLVLFLNGCIVMNDGSSTSSAGDNTGGSSSSAGVAVITNITVSYETNSGSTNLSSDGSYTVTNSSLASHYEADYYNWSYYVSTNTVRMVSNTLTNSVLLSSVTNYTYYEGYNHTVTNFISNGMSSFFLFQTNASGIIISGLSDTYSNAQLALKTNLILPEYISGLPVRMLGTNAFANNQEISNLVLPDNMETIAYQAMIYSMIYVIHLGTNLKVIEYRGICNCNNLKTITFPASLQIIHSDGIAYNNNITNLVFKGTTPPSMNSYTLTGTVWVYAPYPTIALKSTFHSILVPSISLNEYKSLFSSLIQNVTFGF